MVIFMLVGVFGSFVAIAMVIAVLKCCVESLADDTDNRQKLGNINTYKSRYANTYRRNTYDTDDLTEVWTTNDNNETDTQWNSSNIESGGNEGDLRLEDGCDSITGVRNDSKPEGDNDPKFQADNSTLGGENKAISGAGEDSKLEGSAHDHDASFSGGSHSVFGRSEQEPTFGAGSHSTFGGGSHLAFGGGHDSSFGGGYDAGNGGGTDTGFGTGSDSGFGGDSGGGGVDYGGGGGGD